MAEALNYTKLAQTYLFMWRKHLPENAKESYSSLLAFAQLLTNVKASSQLNLADVDHYIETICSNLTEEQSIGVCDIFEQYFDFLMSRGYCEFNPFRPSCSPVQHETMSLSLPNTKPDDSVTPVILSEPIQNNSLTDTPYHEPSIKPSTEETTTDVQPEAVFQKGITSLNQLINKFLKTRRDENRLKENSIKAYRKDFKMFQNFISSHKLTFNYDAIQKYARFLNLSAKKHQPKLRRRKLFSSPTTFVRIRNKRLAATSVGRRKNSLRSLLNFGCEEHYLDNSVNWKKSLYTSRQEKNPKNSHQALSLEETNQIITYLASERVSLRDKLEFLILLGCGPRAKEVVPLKVKNINFANHCLHLTKTKGDKRRDVPIPTYVIPFIKDYITENNFSEQDYLFPTRQSKFMTTKTLNSDLSRIVQEAGILRKVTVHDLRATCTTYLLHFGRENENVVKDILGHEDITTTFGYCASWHRDETTPTLKTIEDHWTSLLYPEGFPNEKVYPLPTPAKDSTPNPRVTKSSKVIPLIPSCKKANKSSRIEKGLSG